MYFNRGHKASYLMESMDSNKLLKLNVDYHFDTRNVSQNIKDKDPFKIIFKFLEIIFKSIKKTILIIVFYGISGLIAKRNRLKFLTLHSPFCIFIWKNTQTEWLSWVL